VKGTWSQFACFIITYYFLLHASTHLSLLQGEPSTQENIHENISVYPRLECAPNVCIRYNSVVYIYIYIYICTYRKFKYELKVEGLKCIIIRIKNVVICVCACARTQTLLQTLYEPSPSKIFKIVSCLISE
jgi:hypothetical protein